MTDDGLPHDGHVGDLVSARLDGELRPETAAWVDSHLRECAACRDLAQATEAARAWVRSLPEVDGSVVVERFLARHRTAVRAGAAFVGVAAGVLGALALSAAVLRTDLVPEVDALVAAHLSSDVGATGGDLEAMEGIRHVRSLGRPYSAPAAVIGNRVSLSRRSMLDGDDLAVVIYGDGDVFVSVFQQPGRIEWSALPAGTTQRVGRRLVWVPAEVPHERGGGPVVMVSEVGGVVVTVVGDDLAGATTVMDGLPESSRGSAWDRVHDACVRFTEVFAIGGD
ncbi:MAG: zf-HC2 domain-containing protein [Acidimicrobiales bacterium]